MDAASVQSAFKEAAKELDELKESCGMVGTDYTVFRASLWLESIKEQSGQTDISSVVNAMSAIRELQVTLEKMLQDPTNFGPQKGGCVEGCMSVFAKWYGEQVKTKLGKVADDGKSVLQLVADFNGKISKVMEQLQTVMNSTIPTIETEVKQLMSLPQELLKIADTLDDGPAAIANINMTPIEESLDVTPINAPLDSLKKMQGGLGPMIKEVEAGAKQLSVFVQSAPNKVKASFEVAPCIPVASIAPPAMTTLLNQLDVLKKFDMQPLIDMLAGSDRDLGDLDIEQVRGPVAKFAEAAKTHTAKITDTIEQAKAAAAAFEKAKRIAAEAKAAAEQVAQQAAAAQDAAEDAAEALQAGDQAAAAAAALNIKVPTMPSMW